MDLTRKVLILEAIEDGVLDYNYHYELMKEIYKSIEVANSKKAKKLHDEGFKIDNKIYKLFNNQLFIENAQYEKDGIHIDKNSKIKLTISGAELIIKEIITGFIQRGELELFKNKFKVVNMDSDKRVRLDNISLYKVRTPVVATIQNEKKEIVYTSPYQQDDFFRILANNLLRKYRLIYNKEYSGELFFDIEDIFTIKKKFISNIKSKGFVIGYTDFEIYIQADKDMQKVAYNCGLGSNNSLGMGFITHIMSRRD